MEVFLLLLLRFWESCCWRGLNICLGWLKLLWVLGRENIGGGIVLLVVVLKCGWCWVLEGCGLGVVEKCGVWWRVLCEDGVGDLFLCCWGVIVLGWDWKVCCCCWCWKKDGEVGWWKLLGLWREFFWLLVVRFFKVLVGVGVVDKVKVGLLLFSVVMVVVRVWGWGWELLLGC